MSESARLQVALAEALREAIGTMEEMLPYIPEYFRDKWAFGDQIDTARSALQTWEEA